MTKAETSSAARPTTPNKPDAAVASNKKAAGKTRPPVKITPMIVFPTAVAVFLAYLLLKAYEIGKAEAIDNTWANTPWAAPIVASVVYLSFVNWWGPALMKGRPAMELQNSMLVYNVYQTVLNIAMCYGFVKAVYDLGWSWWGNELDLSHTTYDIGFWIWVHYTNKYIELLDTVFMILRNKHEQVSFLHVYHHCLLIWAWFAVSKVACGGDAYFGALANSFIHVLMYSYYAMALLVSMRYTVCLGGPCGGFGSRWVTG